MIKCATTSVSALAFIISFSFSGHIAAEPRSEGTLPVCAQSDGAGEGLGSSTYGCGGYGGGFQSANGGPGAGGASKPGGAGVLGQNAQTASSGGGGGGGAGTTGGFGGAGGTGGGAGGQGGVHGNTSSLTGSNGGVGQNGSTGGGGGGGAGGYGLVSEGDYVNTGAIKGGDGGKGGDSASSAAGQGGSGGHGIVFTAAFQLDNMGGGTITGGAGGGTGSGMYGEGGRGGSAVVGTGLTVNNSGTLVGGNGGVGGLGYDQWGSLGGEGILNPGADKLTVRNSNGGTIAGGNGGNAAGGVGAAGSNNGGVAGDGIYSPYSEVDITNTGTISGGEAGMGTVTEGVTGQDGKGGSGITAGWGMINNSGTILGGDAVTSPNAGVVLGSAGVGIYGSSNLTVINDGTISGGLETDGVTHANAITFKGNDNRLELHSQYAITGNVDASDGSNNTFALGGGGTGSFDASTLGQQYLGFGSFVKTGESVWTLTGTPSAAVPTSWTIEQGILAVSSDSNLGVSNEEVTFAGNNSGTVPTLRFLDNVTLNRAVQLQTDGVLDTQNHQVTASGVIAGGGALTKDGSGTLILTTENTYDGGTTIQAGTLQLGAGGDTGGIKGDVGVENGAMLAFNRMDDVTFDGVISGAGSVSQVGAGTTILTAENTYDGGTTIQAGTLQLGAGGDTGGIKGDVGVENGAMLAFNRMDDVTFDGVISGAGSVSQVGAGTTILTANNTYAGTTNVASGTLALAQGAALSGGGAVYVSPGANFGGYGAIAGSVYSTGTVAVADALAAFADRGVGTLTIGGNIDNSGLVNLVGKSVGNTLHVLGNYSTDPAKINMATYLNEGGALSNQLTDRVLIEGNATGNTTVNIVASGTGAITAMGRPSATTGISIIQVGGNSTMDAFQLEGGKVNLGTPYEYGLYAFGPDSTYGSAAADQSLVGNKDSNWDYRLESIYVTPEGPVEPGDPESPEERPEVVPSVPNYLSVPTALFNAGFWDMDTLHRRLGEIRYDPAEPAPEGEVFMRAYGGKQVYKTNRSFVDYGYGFDQDYAAIQLGGSRIVHADEKGTWRLGLAAAFGRMWLYPDAIDGYSSSIFNKQTGMLTATYQARTGWYVDGILMAGLFDGHVSTHETGRVGLRGTAFGGSIEGGYPIDLGDGISLEPQFQLVYQTLHINRKVDASGMSVNLGSPDAWIMRAGARLSKAFTSSDGSVTTPYLKANFIHGFGDENTVHIGQVPFRTGRLGEYVQFGAGITGKVKKDLSLYADGAWQTPVSNNGFRGWTINAGVRMTF